MLLGVDGCCWMLLDVVGCCWMLMDVVGCCWMLLDAVGCCWMLLDVVGCSCGQSKGGIACGEETAQWNSPEGIPCHRGWIPQDGRPTFQGDVDVSV